MTANANFSWVGVSGAIRYDYEVVNLYTGEVEHTGEVFPPLTFVNLSGIFVETEYEFKVKTICINEVLESEFAEIIDIKKINTQFPNLKLKVMALGSFQGGLTFDFTTDLINTYTETLTVNSDVVLIPGGFTTYTRYTDYTDIEISASIGSTFIINENTIYLKSNNSYDNPIPKITIYVNWKGTETLTPLITNKMVINDAPLGSYIPIDFSHFGINLSEAVLNNHTIEIGIIQEDILELTPTEVTDWLEENFEIIYP